MRKGERNINWMSKARSICAIGATAAMFMPGPCTGKNAQNVHPYRYSDVDMPVSLALGNVVRTPEFKVQKQAYFIMVQAEKGQIPFVDLKCMMGLVAGPTESAECEKEPVLKAEWKVLDGDRIVEKGSNSLEADARYENASVFKFLGQFMGGSDKNYVVEVRFTKDGTPLNVANPHLIVISVKNH